MRSKHTISGAQRSPLERGVSALPDALTALYFLSLWLFPLMYGPHAMRNALLLMLVEFLLLHASVFLGHTAFSASLSRQAKLLRIGGFMLFYAVFIGLWAFVFRAWWPLLAFGWLLLSKFAGVFGREADNAERLVRMKSLWVIGAMAYLGGVFATVMLPLPQLGITEKALASFDMPVTGIWAEQPQTLAAFGLLYFGTLALVKWRGWRLPRIGATAAP